MSELNSRKTDLDKYCGKKLKYAPSSCKQYHQEHGDGQLVVTLHVSDSGSQVPLLLALHSNPSNYGRSHQLTQFVCHHPQH